jgi:hypothetical protein
MFFIYHESRCIGKNTTFSVDISVFVLQMTHIICSISKHVLHIEQTNRFPSCLLLTWRFKAVSYTKTLLHSLHLNSLIPCEAFLWATRSFLWQYLLSQFVHVYCFSWKQSWKSVFKRYIYIQFLNLEFHQLIKLFLNCKRNKKHKVPKGSIKLSKSL